MPDYKLGWRRGPERPEKWRYRLVPVTAPDPSKPRSLAKYATVLFDQGAIGSCTANAGCLVAMMAAQIAGAAVPVLSRMWKYYNERIEIHTFPEDSGADVVDEYDTDKTTGEIAESVWPYDANVSEQPPASAAQTTKYKPIAGWQPIAASDFRDGILTALDNNMPVSIGLNVWNGWEEAWEQSGIWSQAGMSGGIAGGHAVAIIGWVPPNALFSQGAYLFQNSWGASSPNNTSLHPDCTPGRGLLDAATFALSQVGAEADAVVGATAPAILSVTVTPPASAEVGVASAWSATVTGLPAGSVAQYSWAFNDGGSASGQQVSYAPRATGTLTGTCTVSVASTGARSSGSASVSVAPAPNPEPGPSPTPVSACQTQTDAAFAQALAATNAARAKGDIVVSVSWYAAMAEIVTWAQGVVDAALSAPSTAAALAVPVPPPPPHATRTAKGATITSPGATIILDDGPITSTYTLDNGDKVRVP